MIDVGEIEQVDPRKLGIHEEHDFTPWLLQNINRIGEVLGIDIALDAKEREVGVGRYWADIEATEVGTNRKIVIENQITPSDHKHLGQTLTYAAGLESSIVIWVCTEFREEHRQTLDWLNNMGGDRVGFFGVEFEFIRIDGSRPAIRFKPVVRPAAWEASESEDEEASGNSPYIPFYQALMDELREKHRFTNVRKAQRQNWYAFSSGHSGIKYLVSFKSDGRLYVETRIDVKDRQRNKAIFDNLLEHRETVETALGQSLTWDRNDNYQYSTIYASLPASIELEDRYDEYRAWTVAQLLAFKKAFGPFIPEALASAGVQES